jgi:hypothetical protein
MNDNSVLARGHALDGLLVKVFCHGDTVIRGFYGSFSLRLSASNLFFAYYRKGSSVHNGKEPNHKVGESDDFEGVFPS